MKTKNIPSLKLLISLCIITIMGGLLIIQLKIDEKDSGNSISIQISRQYSQTGTTQLAYDEYYALHDNADDDYEIYWDFECTNLVEIKVMAMDEEEYDDFSQGQPSVYESLSTGETSDSGYFTPDYDDEWYIVFSHMDSSEIATIANVEYEVEYEEIYPSYNPFSFLYIILIPIVLIGIVVIVVFLRAIRKKNIELREKRKRETAQMQQVSYSQTQTPYQNIRRPSYPALDESPLNRPVSGPPAVGQRPVITSTNKFCTYCGKKMDADASFCPLCGTKVS